MSPPKVKPTNGSGSSSRIMRGLERRGGIWERLLDMPVAWAALTVVVCTSLLVPRLDTDVPTWPAGEVATYDVVIPRDLSLPDEAATTEARVEAREAVLPVFDVEPRIRRELATEIQEVFAVCRLWLADDTATMDDLSGATVLAIDPAMTTVLAESECSGGLETAILEVVDETYRVGIVDDRRELDRRGARGVVLRDLSGGPERRVALDELSNVVDGRSGLSGNLQTTLLSHEAVARRWVKPTLDFLEANMLPDIVLNRAETAARIAKADQQVVPRSRVLRRGQVLVRRGDRVSPEVAQTLRVIDSQRREVTEYSRVLGVGLLVLVVVASWWPIRQVFGSAPGEVRQRLSMTFILLMLFVALNRFGLFIVEAISKSVQGQTLSTLDSYLWGLPFAAGPVAVLLLMGLQPALVFAVSCAIMAGLLLEGQFTLAVFALVSGVVGVVVSRRSTERSAMSRIGLYVGLANCAAFLVLELYRGLPAKPESTLFAAGCALVGGLLAIGLVTPLLPLLETLLGVTTDQRLLELSNQNLPLLKRLSLEAPGTYQHSLAVSNLVEAGADAVGANALYLRVCAYYHDIGKLTKPQYFVENQRGTNPHDELSPSMSVLVIQSHVKKGIEMAREAKLPLPIIHGIATHHGTKLIRYFFHKAQEGEEGKKEVRESDFRYPGPKPHTKELGILLLADAVEAAARTIEQPNPTRLQSMIKKIFDDALEDGQLDDSELTFSELDKVASAFLWVLTNMYHHRIDYPGFNFNRRNQTSDSGSFQLGTPPVRAGG
ncbi:MAG: HDIG domain-containing metalloprotein [Thermoanaerobaculales bacterium]|jgi:putative nucleotidyltransferase with HDIG domain|nr:HDIG domain-containing metalloprotein [Thermoanaerobaculales bacterium]